MKKKWTIGILFVVILLGAISMIALVMQNRKQDPNTASSSFFQYKKESYEKIIELDQVYKESDDYATYYYIFKSDGSFISIQDRANIYKTQAELDEAGNEEEMAITPTISYSKGSYRFVDHAIELSYGESIEMDFSTVNNIKDNKYFTIEREDSISKVIWKKSKMVTMTAIIM